MKPNFYKKGLIEINNKWIYLSLRKSKDCLFSRRNGFEGLLLFGYSFYIKIR